MKRKHDMALADYTEALLLDPADASSLLGRGIIFGEKGQFGQALADLTEAVRLAPNDPRAYKNRGYFLSLQGDHERAIADFNEAIRLEPDGCPGVPLAGDDPRLRAATRTVPHRPGKRDPGIRRRAGWPWPTSMRRSASSPSDPMAYRCRAAALARLGDHKQALADYDAAIRLDPNDPGSAERTGRAAGRRPERLT